MTPRDLLIMLAVWRICVLLLEDDWPFFVMTRFRTIVGVYDLTPPRGLKGQLAMLFSCVYCMSIWVSLFVVALLWVTEGVVEDAMFRVLAYSAGAVIIEELVNSRDEQ